MRTFVARGIVLASSLLATGSATAQNPVYGTPSLLPPANSGDAIHSTSTARSLPPVPRNAAPVWTTKSTAYGSDADNGGYHSIEPTEQISVLAERVRQETPPPATADNPPFPPAPSHHSQPNGNGNYQGSCVDNSIIPADSLYPGYSGGSSGYAGCNGSISSTSTYPACEIAGCGRGWYAGAGGLIMTRDNENNQFFSYDDNNESIQLTNSRNADMNWAGGFETWIGRYFNCGCNAVEVGYWQLFPGQSSTMTTGADVVGNLNGIHNWDQITYDGNTGDTYVNNAAAHRIDREFDFQNLELNILNFSQSAGMGMYGGPGATWNWLAGVRWFRFEEYLQFGADANDTVFDGEADELYYRIRTENNLVGGQLGGNGRLSLSDRLGLHSGVKVGVYNNDITSRSVIGGANGTATINNGPFNGAAWDITSNKDDVAFLAELNLGFNFQHSYNWSSYAGYRAVAVTGVALPTNQIYPDLRGINDVAVAESNGSLILHGAYAGLTYSF